jgi:hypothetical protein
VCDDYEDCVEGEDEAAELCGAPSGCAPDEYECADGECIPDYWVCDSISDCAGGEDEAAC